MKRPAQRSRIKSRWDRFTPREHLLLHQRFDALEDLAFQMAQEMAHFKQRHQLPEEPLRAWETAYYRHMTGLLRLRESLGLFYHGSPCQIRICTSGCARTLHPLRCPPHRDQYL